MSSEEFGRYITGLYKIIPVAINGTVLTFYIKFGDDILLKSSELHNFAGNYCLVSGKSYAVLEHTISQIPAHRCVNLDMLEGYVSINRLSRSMRSVTLPKSIERFYKDKHKRLVIDRSDFIDMIPEGSLFWVVRLLPTMKLSLTQFDFTGYLRKSEVGGEIAISEYDFIGDRSGTNQLEVDIVKFFYGCIVFCDRTLYSVLGSNLHHLSIHQLLFSC